MVPTVKFDTLAMDRMLAQLVAYSPVSVRDTLRAEAGSILKTCAGRTKVAKPARAEIDARRMALRKGDAKTDNAERVSVTIGMRDAGAYGKVWRLTGRNPGSRDVFKVQQTHGPNFAPLNRHYGEESWREIQRVVARFVGALKMARPAIKGAAGLARQSWIQIADDIGIRLEDVPGGTISAAGLAKARRAIATNGRSYKSGEARELGEARRFTIRLTNNLPYGRKISLDRVLVGAIQGRVKFFERNVALGVFKSLEKTLKAYPGVRLAYTGSPVRQN